MIKIKKIYKGILLFVYINLLKRKANKMYAKTGMQQFVVKWRGKIIIISKEQFKLNRQEGLFPLSFTAVNLKKIALYYTKNKTCYNQLNKSKK